MKISLILPYWNRQSAANDALRLLERAYAGMDLEVVIVDDGNPIPFAPPDTKLNIVVVTLPKKGEPKCPATAWNAGAKASTGEIIVLSCIEILHEKPVLQEMAEHLGRLGSRGYVLAAAWCPEHGSWHCHSTVGVPDCPSGVGIAFCGAMYRDLFFEVGGFDEAYRDGAGYEDRDFVRKMVAAGAKFVVRDDLVVTHPKSGATIAWPDGSFERNEAIYLSKWPSMAKRLTFVCLKVGTAFGPEYVNNLYDMVSRNLRAMPARFVCVTDDAVGLNPAIVVKPVPADLEKWWGKLYLFKRGLFQDGERMIFLDLDTLIVGSLNDLVKYDGQFATLRDFYVPERVGPAVMLWEAGEYTASIWDEWVAEGKPRNAWGDLWWLNRLDQGRFAKNADKLQDLYPGWFVSYKAHCNPYPPKGAKVVCFHGEPRPHNCGAEWVKKTWAVGGFMAAELEAVANTERERVATNIRTSSALDVPWLDLVPEHDGDAVLVGGGPSLEKGMRELIMRQQAGAKVFAQNGSFAFLRQYGIEPDAHIIMDARPENQHFITGQAKAYYIASQCAPEVFQRALPAPVTLFHMNTAGVQDSIPANDKPLHLISSGSTVGLAAMAIAYCLGYRKLHLYGYDSSYEDKKQHHAYAQTGNDDDRTITVSAGDRTFRCAPWMAMQAQQFQELSNALAEAGCTITVNGDGLIPHIAHEMARQLRPLLEAA